MHFKNRHIKNLGVLKRNKSPNISPLNTIETEFSYNTFQCVTSAFIEMNHFTVPRKRRGVVSSIEDNLQQNASDLTGKRRKPYTFKTIMLFYSKDLITKTCCNIWNNQANIWHFSDVLKTLTSPFENVLFESTTKYTHNMIVEPCHTPSLRYHSEKNSRGIYE